MKIREKITIATIFLLISCLVRAQQAQIAEEELKVLFKPQITSILENYQVYSQFTIKGDKIETSYVSQFLSLFFPTDGKVIFNDLKLSGSSAESFLTPTEYTSFVKMNYPSGLDVSLFDLKNIEILRELEKKDNYILTVKIRKKITGVYRNEKIYKYSGFIYFTFMANISNTLAGSSTELKISNIHNEPGYFRFTANNKMKGLYVGLSGGMSNTELMNIHNLGRFVAQNNYLKGFDLSYFVTRGFGLGTGMGLNTYSTKCVFQIASGYSMTSKNYIDPEGDAFIPQLYNVYLTQADKIQSIDIPILLKFRTGKAKTGIYIDMGLLYSKFSSSTYSLNGEFTRKGYYPAYKVVLEGIPVKGYNFQTYEYSVDQTPGTIKTPGSGLSAIGSIGVSIPIKKIVYLKLGSNFVYGLQDIPFTYPGHLILVDKYSTRIKSLAFEIGLSYKLTNRYKY